MLSQTCFVCRDSEATRAHTARGPRTPCFMQGYSKDSSGQIFGPGVALS